MEFQTNPFLIWQLLPALILLWLGIYVQSRRRKKAESGIFALLLFAGACWSLLNAIQLTSANPAWQIFWHQAAYLAILTIPTAWFLFAVAFSGYLRPQVEKLRAYFLIVPALTYLAILSNGYHQLFYPAYEIHTVGGFSTVTGTAGILFHIHIIYSYILLFLGMLLLGIALFTNFKSYGVQAFGLIPGMLLPVVGNGLYIYGGLFPPGFPDPTPLLLTVTGIAFAWAIFAGRILDVVPIAHESLVANLTDGILVLDLDHRILDANPTAREILGLEHGDFFGLHFLESPDVDPELATALQTILQDPPHAERKCHIIPSGNNKTYEITISPVRDRHDRFTGRMLQFTDVSRHLQAEKNLASAQASLTSILDTLKEYYFETDLIGTVTNINQPFCEHLGYARKEELLGKHIRHFTDQETFRQIFQNFSKVIETKQTTDLFRYAYRTKDGAKRIGETTVSPIIAGDTVIGARCVLRDITDRLTEDAILRQTMEDVEAQARELAAINRIANLSNQSLNLNNILQTLCQELTRIFPVRNAGIGLITPDRTSLEVVAFHSVDADEESALGLVLPFEGNQSSQEVVEQKKTLVIQDAQQDPRMRAMVDVSKARGTRAIMIVPLLTRGKAIGTIGMPAKEPDYIFDKNEIKLAEIIASQIAAAIDNAQLYERTENALDVVEQDLEIGRQIQSGFFPETIPTVPGWEFAAHFEAARQVAGDFYDIFQFKNTHMTALVIADVCDKGVGAALFMVLFRSLLRAFSQIDVQSDNVQACLSSIIANTNNYVSRVHGESNMFATLFFGILDDQDGILHYVNGGHEPPAILDKDGRLVCRLMPTGPAVGMFPEAVYRVGQYSFNPGDFLVGFTDGVSDAQNEKGQLFTQERLLEYIQTPWTSLFSMIFELKTELRNHMGGYKQFDDITLISMRRKLTQDVERHGICRPSNMGILGEVRDFAESAAVECHLNQADAQAFKLAAEEACTNIIRYGYAGKDPGYLSIFFETCPGKARLIIRDDGTSISPVPIGIPARETSRQETQMGGPGMPALNELMDNVSYNRMEQQGNQLILEKNIKN